MLILYKNDRNVRFVLFTKTSNNVVTNCHKNFTVKCHYKLSLQIVTTNQIKKEPTFRVFLFSFLIVYNVKVHELLI